MLSEQCPRTRLTSGLYLPDITFRCYESRFGEGDIVDQFQTFLSRVMDLNRLDGRLQDIIVNQRFFVSQKSVKTLPIDDFAHNLYTLYEEKTEYHGRNRSVGTILFQSIDGTDRIVFEEPHDWLRNDRIKEIKAGRREFAEKSQPFIESILDAINYKQTDFS